MGSATFSNGLGDIREIVGGSPLLLDRSAYGFPTSNTDGRNPRSAIAWNEQDVMLVAVDGRQSDWSLGVTYIEMSQMVRWLGATAALNLDGGWSTALAGFGDTPNRPPAARPAAHWVGK